MKIPASWTRSKTSLIIAIVSICLALFSSPAQAQSLGRTASGGNGCTNNGAQAVLSRDGRTLKLVVRGYQAKVDGSRSFDRKTCNFTIPVDVPPGKRFAIVSATYNGENSLPSGTESVLRVEYFFPGTTGTAFERTFMGSLRRAFTVPTTVSPVWSGCGADTILRVNSSLRVSSTNRQVASIALSSRRAGAAVVRLEWRNC